MKTMQALGLTASMVFAALASTSAGAATWTAVNSDSSTSVNLTAGSGPSVAASAYFATSNSATISGASLQNYSGDLGVLSGSETRGSSPNHAMDNQGRIETIMLAFSDGVSGITDADKVNLSQVSFGYASGDSDFSVYAYTGSSASPTPAGLTYSTLNPSNGWTLIGHYNGGASANTYSIANSVYSSHWLIGAYNGLTGTGSGNTTAGYDYFKLKSLTGSTRTGQTPEPGTLLLMGAGLFGLSRFNARRSLRFAA